MTDDWSTPTGEHEHNWLEPANAELFEPAPPPDEELDPVFGVTESELRMADVFFFEAGLVSAREPRCLSTEEEAAVAELRERADRLKTMTPEELEAERQRLMRSGY